MVDRLRHNLHVMAPRYAVLASFYIVFINLNQEAFGEEASNCTNTTTLRNGETLSKCCVFPFLYNGELHRNCVNSDGNTWCSLTANYDVDHKKITCTTSNHEADSEKEKCHNFPSGLSSLTGGPKDVAIPWKIQCLSSYAMVSLWNDVSRFRTLDDVKCCDAPVDQNISHIFNLTRQDGGSNDVNLPWRAQCPRNYIITGLYAESSPKLRTLKGLSAVKCSLVLDNYVDYGSCSAVHLADNTGGSREPGVTWKTECPSGQFIVGVYNDKTFMTGVKQIKCCPLKAITLNQRLCSFEQGMCTFWGLGKTKPRIWQINNSTMLENGDHTTGKASGHILLYKTNRSSNSYYDADQISSIGLRTSKQGRCLSLWFLIKKFTRLSIMSFRYNEVLELPVRESLGDIEGSGTSKWAEKQVVLPQNTNYQLIIDGFTTTSAPGEIALDDIMIRPEQFCTGVCSSLGPLQGSSSIHDGPIVLWHASCLQGNGGVTSAMTGLWDKQGSHFKVIEYMKCCNMPVKETYKMSLVGREGGPINVDVPWYAQCRNNHVITGIYSLNKFNGLYQLQCGALQQSRINYSKCVAVWSEVRNHVGDAITLHVECPPNMVVVAMYDHHGDNNKTSFADVDAIKCCDVIMPNCVTRDDCHSNADCISDNDINRCACKVGYQGNGKFCLKRTPLILPTTSALSTKRTDNIPSSTQRYKPTQATTRNIIGDVTPSQYIHQGGSVGTSSFQHKKQPTNHKKIIIILSILSAVLFLAVISGVLVWQVRKAAHARHRVTGNCCIKEAEMSPINHIESYDNLCEQKDERINGSALPVVAVDQDNAAERKVSRARKARSATILSVDHPYVDEKDLDQSKQRLGQPFYFELDKSANQKNYTLHRSLALPEPMYGILEPEHDDSAGDEIGAQFYTPAATEEELYLQLSRAIPRDKIEVGSEKLGSGAFGHVWLGVWNKSPGIPTQVAVKILRDSHSAVNKIKFLQEAAIMRQFTHKNVIYMYGTVTTSQPVMIVLEYMSRGNLKNYLRSLNTKYGEEVVLEIDTRTQFLRMARDIAAGMQYLHSLSFVHRDLAARNILLDSDMTCKIGDFGMSRDLVESDYYTSSGGRIPVKWTAPEAINFGKYSSSSDVWSYGIVLYEIWSLGHKPYLNLDNNEVIEAVSLGYRLPPPVNCPNMVYRLMVDCWHPDSQLRPRSYQIHHCLCFSHQSVFLDDSVCKQQYRPPELESATNTSNQTYMDLKYVYATEE